MNPSSLIASLALLTFITQLTAAEEDHWDVQFGAPGAESLVLAVAPHGTNIYVGGIFRAAGEAASTGIARWDGSRWHSLAGGVSGGSLPSVYAIQPHGDRIYVGGLFTNAGPVAARNLACWNGSTWEGVGGGVNGYVFSLLQVGNDLYVAGLFSLAGSVNATNIARWDGTSWWPVGEGLTSETNFNWTTVNSLASDGTGNIFAAGVFKFAGGQTVNNVARWDGTAWHGLGTGLTGVAAPSASQIQYHNGSLYAAGLFRSADGVNATNVARWDGSQWSAMGGGPSGTNTAITFVGDTLYTAGAFTNIAGTKVLNVARWNGGAWEPLAAGTAGEINTKVTCLGSDGTNLFAGGDFLRAGHAGVMSIARWNGDSWSALMGPNTRGMFFGVREISIVGTNTYYGGTMTVAGGLNAGRMIRWDGTQWDTLNGGVIGSGSISTIIESGGQIYAGGSFTNVGGVTTKNVARWDGSAWHAMASGLNSNVNALVVHKGQIFAGGAFNARGNNTGGLPGVAMWDGSDWQGVPSISEWRINNVFNSLVSDGTHLYAGGNYYIGWQDPLPPHEGEGLNNIGYWDGVNWHSMGAALGNTVSALAFYNGELHAGGSFTNSGGTLAKRIARWNGAAWTAVGSGFDNGSVSALAASTATLYAGGTFTNAGGTTIRRIAKWNGSQWSGLGSGATNTASEGSGSVACIALSGDDVFIAGSFNRAGGKPSMGIGRWNETLSFAPPPVIQIVTPRWQNGQFQFDIGGLSEGGYSVQASTNLIHWETISSNNIPGTPFTDPAAPALPHRVYRVTVP